MINEQVSLVGGETLRLSDSQLAGEIANLERLRLNPAGLSTRESCILLALWELRDRRGHETKPDEATAAHWLGELLAIIHRDGGQYEAKHGTILATQDAIKIVHVLRGDRNCKVCDGMGYSVGVSKRIPCDECDGTGLALLAEHARPSVQETCVA